MLIAATGMKIVQSMHVNSFHFIHLCLRHGESGQLLGYLYSNSRVENNLRGIGASDEVVARCASVGDRASIAAVVVDDNAVRTRRTCKERRSQLQFPVFSNEYSPTVSSSVTYHQCKHHSW